MRLETRIRSTAMGLFCSPAYLQLLRNRARLRRRLKREPAAVHYFHQVDDPYSHLAVQKLDQLRAGYRLPFRTHLVAKPAAAYRGSERHFDHWALRDAASIAADYQTRFPDVPEGASVPASHLVTAANDTLARHLDQPDFATAAVSVGEALWQGNLAPATADDGPGQAAVARGNALRQRLGHYLGGMFYFDGEWFWGIDRIRLLERRLIDEGFADTNAALCVPEPTPADTSGLNARDVVLEYFPSLRSPYTAVGHQRVLDLIARSGVTVELRPVMPMMMRGIPAPRAKQRYIIIDAGREARAHGVPFGRIVDPFGEPVKQAFALFPGALALGRGMEYVTAYLSAAWAQGVDITTEAGRRRVAEGAGLDWAELGNAADGADWEGLLDDNLQGMLAAGLWGVPSFRVTGGRNPTGGRDSEPFACWGQDRIWRVAREIARRADPHTP